MLKQIPNIITIIRMLLVVPIGVLLWQTDYYEAFILIFIAGFSDALDGFLARVFHWKSDLGALLDPIADKLLLTCVFIILGLKGELPLWLVALVFGRDAIISFGAIAYQRVTHKLKMRPLFISKLNTTAQILLLLATMFHLIKTLPILSLQILITLVTITTISSGLAYVILWLRYTMNYVKRDEIKNDR